MRSLPEVLPMDRLPSVSPELIEYLEKLYPDHSPSLKTPDREIWFKAGQVDVVRHLRRLFDYQNETVLNGE
jgi:hypothetical protein